MLHSNAPRLHFAIQQLDPYTLGELGTRLHITTSDLSAGEDLKVLLQEGYIQQVEVSTLCNSRSPDLDETNVLLMLCATVPYDYMMYNLYHSFPSVKYIICPYDLAVYSTKKTTWLPRGSIYIYTRDQYYHLQGKYYISERERILPPPNSLPVDFLSALKVPKPKKLLVLPPSNNTNKVPSRRSSRTTIGN